MCVEKTATCRHVTGPIAVLFCDLCVMPEKTHRCVAEARKQGSQFDCVGVSADACLLCLGSFPVIAHTHVC